MWSENNHDILQREANMRELKLDAWLPIRTATLLGALGSGWKAETLADSCRDAEPD